MKKNVSLVLCFLFAAPTVLSAVSAGAQATVSVTTWHNDNWRTGQNTNETRLTTSNVNKSSFGLLCRIQLSSITTSRPAYSNQIYAEPLVVGNGNSGSTLYVVTQGDFLYSFILPLANNWSQTSCSNLISNLPHAPIDLLANFPNEFPADCCYLGTGSCGTVSPTVGVLGTPTAPGALYVLAESQVGPSNYSNPGPQGSPPSCPNPQGPPTGGYVHRLHALDLSNSLAETFNGPVQISAGFHFGNVSFDSGRELQRPGLLWVPGQTPQDPTLDIAFSMMDGTIPQPSGWLFSYHAVDLTAGGYPKYYATTGAANGVGNLPRGGGIWQGGAAPAEGLDANGAASIFFSTAEGIFDLNNTTAPNSDSGDSFVKLPINLPSPSGFSGFFSSSNYFAPTDQNLRWCGGTSDVDFGSGGIILVPDNLLTNWPFLAIKGDKEGGIWAIDRTIPNGFNPACSTGCATCTQPNNNLQTVYPPGAFFHSTPAYWNNSFYIAGVHTSNTFPLTKFPLNINGSCGSQPICTSNAVSSNVTFRSGTTPSVSSNGTSNGIVWAINKPDGPAPSAASPCVATPGSGQTCAVLYAFDGGNMTELYDSNQCQNGTAYPDAPGAGTKFSVPTIANGYVIIGTQTEVDIYGTNPTRTCTN